MRLFSLLTQADEVIAQMRAGSATPVHPDAPPPLAPTRAPAATEALRTPPPAPRGPRVSTVPAVLLGLGALCVLVAASLFLPFAWELLGVLGRTVVLIALTAAAAAAARVAGVRNLRASAEALGVVSLGLLTFDVIGARSSGWFGEIDDAGFAVLLGGVLLLTGTAAHVWIRRTAVGAFVGGEVVAVIGGVVLALGLAALEVGTLAQRLALVVPLMGAVTVGTAALRAPRRGLDLTGAPTGHLVVATGAWAALAVSGVAGLDDGPDGGLSWAALWPGGAGLTLLLGGAYVALPALAQALPSRVRAGLLSVALVPWGVMVTAPAFDEGTTWRTMVAVLVLLACLLGGQLAAPAWRAAALPLGALSAAAATLLAAPLLDAAVATFAATMTPPWSGTPGGSAVAAASTSWATGATEDLGAPWLLPVVAAVLSLVSVVASRHAGPGTGAAGEDPAHAGPGLSPLPVITTAGGTVTVLAACGALLLAEAPVWSVMAVLLVAGLITGLVAGRVARPELHVGELVLGGAALLLSAHDEWLTVLACLVLLLLCVQHHVRGLPTVRLGGGLAATGLLAVALWAGGSLADVPARWGSLVVLLVLGAVAIARGLLEARDADGVDVGAALAATVATYVAVVTAPAPQAATWLAVMLTLAGATTTVVALTRDDRRHLGWAGGLLLAAASWVRLADVGVSAPEAYTLPTALALLVTGWHRTRTRTDPTVGTLAAWSPGLGLALVPSLLWALADPLSWRALLLGLACFVLTVVGSQLRAAAPFAWGATVGAVLVTWEVLPPALEMSAWLVTGLAGAALLVLGASWEQRVNDARSALGYLRALR